MSKLSKNELLEVLKGWYIGEHTQAYKQIWEIIQKPQVTEEWIEEKAREAMNMEYGAEGCGVYDWKDFIRKLMEDVSITVDKEE